MKIMINKISFIYFQGFSQFSSGTFELMASEY